MLVSIGKGWKLVLVRVRTNKIRQLWMHANESELDVLP